MWKESDRQWRDELWRHMLEMLPVEVLVNLAGRGFSMRGRGDVSIYADDILEGQYERMLGEWAVLLGCGRKLLQELRLEALERLFAEGRMESACRLPTRYGVLSARVSLRGDPLEEPFIIRLEAKG